MWWTFLVGFETFMPLFLLFTWIPEKYEMERYINTMVLVVTGRVSAGVSSAG